MRAKYHPPTHTHCLLFHSAFLKLRYRNSTSECGGIACSRPVFLRRATEKAWGDVKESDDMHGGASSILHRRSMVRVQTPRKKGSGVKRMSMCCFLLESICWL